MLITRSTDKPAQHSHDIHNVGSSAINGKLKGTNDALTLSPMLINSFSPGSYGVQAGLHSKYLYFLKIFSMLWAWSKEILFSDLAINTHNYIIFSEVFHIKVVR